MKTMIALLIVSSSSVALARPITQDDYQDSYRDHRDDSSVIVRDHREPVQLQPAPVPMPETDYRDTRQGLPARAFWSRNNRPILLADDVSFMRQRNHDHRPLRIDLDARMRLSKLRLDRQEGRMYVDSIVVTFADGHQQTVDINQMLSARSSSLMIQLDHFGATSVDIYGTTERGRATFDVIGLRR